MTSTSGSSPARAQLDLPLDLGVDLPREPLAEVHRLLLLGAERRERRRQPVDLELHDALGLVDVLEADRAELDLAHAVGQRARHERGGRRGQQDLPAVAGGADPRGAMDVDPDVALLSDDGLAGVDAHADAELGPVRPVVARERLLGGDGGGDGVLRAAEAVEERVALRVDLLAATRAERLADDAPVIRERVGVPVAEPLEQLGRAGDVGEDERDRAALQRASRAEPLRVLRLRPPPPDARVRELDDLEQVHDVDRERERAERDRDHGDRLPGVPRLLPRGTG